MKLAWKQIVIALALGGCVGLAAARVCPFLRSSHHHGGGKFEQRLLDRFSSKLHLTPEQRTQVAAILEVKRSKMDALRTEIKPRFEEIRTSTSAEIRQLLNPDQQQRFDTMEAEWAAKKKRFHERWMGSGGPG